MMDIFNGNDSRTAVTFSSRQEEIKKLLEGRELEKRCRALGAAHIDYLYRLMQEEDVSIGLRIKFQELLNKMGGIGGEDVSNSARVEIVIERA